MILTIFDKLKTIIFFLTQWYKTNEISNYICHFYEIYNGINIMCFFPTIIAGLNYFYNKLIIHFVENLKNLLKQRINKIYFITEKEGL
jgi:hypothetical protein